MVFHFTSKTVFIGTFPFNVIRLNAFVKNSKQFIVVQCELITNKNKTEMLFHNLSKIF